MTPVRAVLFDLDGTLVDTAGEIEVALARAFADVGVDPIGRAEVEALIGRGVRSLVERALVQRDAADHIDVAVAAFERHYDETVGTQARLFPGVVEGLAILEAAGIPQGVVTNKLRHFTVRLLERLGIAPAMRAVIAGDDGFVKKPAPDMLLAACDRMKTPPGATLLLGDSDNDVLAARAAGCPVWCVPYGYNEGRGPETLACDRLVMTVEEAARLVTSR